jgi:hypothetical protein
MMNFGEGDSQMVEFSPAFPYQGAFLLSHIPARFMLVPVVGPGEHGSALVPNDLL